MKKALVYLCLLLWTATASGQPRCNDDGTVTFQYKNDSAKSVMVDVQFAGRHEMKRGTDGQWTVTLGVKGDKTAPVAPDMYPYCYIVDGVSIMDPENPQYFPNEGFKNSLLESSRRTARCPTTYATCPMDA